MSELVQLLHQHPRGVTIAEIAAFLQVTTRSARRYLREMHVDLEAVPERPGGQKRWRIPPVDVPRRIAVRRTQAYALLAARPLFDAMRGSSLYEEIDLASETLLGIARRPGRGPNAGVADAGLERRFRYLPFAPKDYTAVSEELDNVFSAVADLHPLACRYPSPTGDGHDRLKLHPYALLFYKDALWCLALDLARSAVRALELAEMRDTACADHERFSIPEGFELDDYVQGQFGIWPTPTKQHRVVIDFAASVRDHVVGRSVHKSQRIEPLDDGGVRMRLELGDLTEVTSWILGFGSLARVVSPRDLRERVAEELRRALALY
jgi:predicted DNA-binding transcriptional regulator YafY